jgi:hypothetical protein
MNRPLYSFELVQSGQNVIVDACVPLGVGHRIFQLIATAAKVDRAPIATKRPSHLKLAKNPEMVLRSVPLLAAKPAPKVAKRRTRKPSN